MCGFAGVFSINNKVNYDSLLKMQESINHRGPDSNGIWLESTNKIGFCHTRLSILDVTNAGSQPMHSKTNRYVIAFNGEIYNHLDLRKEILLHDDTTIFKGTSDTETLLLCFEYFGIENTVKKSVGMFAFVVWDNVEKVFFLCRDRIGEKPLYYGWNNNLLFFGSELKAFRTHTEFKYEIDKHALSLYFRYSYIPTPFSIYKNIFKLKPGTILRVDGEGNTDSISYWDLQKVAQLGYENPFYGSEIDATNELDYKLNQTIFNQQISDVPIGSFLSGGIDSTLVTAIMQSQTNQKINTFTIGFNEKKYNEANFALNISKYLNTNHHELYLNTDDIINVIPHMSLIYDEPFADSSQLPTYFVNKLAKQSVTVALSGDGGDEIFGGYNRYIQSKRLTNLPNGVKKMLTDILSKFSPKQVDLIYDLLGPLLPTKLRSSNAGNHYIKIINLLKQKNDWEIYQNLVSICNTPSLILREAIEYDKENIFTKSIFNSNYSIENKMMLADSLTYLPDDILCKVDRASMSVSLESRVPFLDHKLIEFSNSLPMNMKIRNGQGKWILKNLLKKYVPDNLLDRPKMGFGLPLDLWMRGPLKKYTENLLNKDQLKNDEYLNASYVSNLLDEHLSGKFNHQHNIWNILMFQSWRKTWL